MKKFTVTAIGAALFATALLLPGATEAQNAPAGIPGYLNPMTGMFTARPARLAATAGLQRTGTIIVTITAVLGSNIPKTTPVSCNVEISSDDNEFSNSASGSALVVRSGKGGTCKVSIPFIFEIQSPTTLMSVFVSLFASTGTNQALSYSASHSFTAFPVSNGNKSLAITLAM